MKHLFNNVYMESSIVYELLANMFLIQCQDSIISTNSKVYKFISKDVINWAAYIKNRLPKESKEELEVFFDYESFYGYGLIPLIWKYRKHTDINEFFTFFENNVDAEEIVMSFFYSVYKDRVDKNLSRKVANNKDAMKVIKTLNIPEKEKWKLVYFLSDPEAAKNRLLKLMKAYYNDIFKNEVENINSKYHEILKKVSKEISESRISKLNDLIAMDYELLKAYKEVIIIPIYYYGITLTTSYIDEDSFIALFGFDRPRLIEERAKDDDIIETLKIITDEKRIRIIQMLNKGNYYGYEIGQKLGLSNSTTSHHLSQLTKYGIIAPLRYENKIYYEVKKDKIREFFEKAIELLTV